MIKNIHIETAISLAKESNVKEEIPVGCVIFDNDGEIISKAYNLVEKNLDPTAHAEILAIREACKKLKVKKLENCSIFVTLEPCEMCKNAIYQAGIKKIFFGAYSENLNIIKKIKIKYASETAEYQFYGGIEERKCSEIIKNFFKSRR
jgi:tRNA(adenine34) deaminase